MPRARHRQVTDLDVTVLGFSGPGLPSARQVLCGDAPRLFFYHFIVYLSSVLERTELCHEVWTHGPQNPQIISNENHHLALLDRGPPPRKRKGKTRLDKNRRPLNQATCQSSEDGASLVRTETQSVRLRSARLRAIPIVPSLLLVSPGINTVLESLALF